MNFLRKNLSLVILIAGILALGVLYLILVKPFMINYNQVKKELAEKEKIYARFKRTGIDPAQAVRELADKRRKLEREYEIIRSFAGRQKARFSEDIVDPGLYFRSTLYKVQKELEEDAASRGMTIPPNLGFSEREVPSADTAELLLKQLSIAQFLLEGFFDSAGGEAGGASVSSVTPLEFVEVISEERNELFYIELPIMINLRADIETLVKLLYEIKDSPEFFLLVADLEMKPAPNLISSDLQSRSGSGPAAQGGKLFDITLLVNGLILP